jgi:hypothetical protein
MPERNDSFTDRLSRYREIDITVTGRKSGRAISNPVWFVVDGQKLYLLPVQGSDTQWYKNVLKNPAMLFRSPSRSRCNLWSRSSVQNTGLVT